MAISKQDVLEYISGLSVLELSELVKDFEEKFGVSAAPVMVAGAGAAVGWQGKEAGYNHAKRYQCDDEQHGSAAASVYACYALGCCGWAACFFG